MLESVHYCFMSINNPRCRTHCEKRINERVDGTIIDFETIGPFNGGVGLDRYKLLKPIVAGFFSGNEIEIIFITGESTEDLDSFKNAVRSKLRESRRPFYAFNAEFEIGVLHWFLGESVTFDRDLMLPVSTLGNRTIWESKRIVIERLGISNFDDPFFDNGYMVLPAWANFIRTTDSDSLEKIIRHNRACLLKECCILNLRGKWRDIRNE